eukprot:g802.t1
MKRSVRSASLTPKRPSSRSYSVMHTQSTKKKRQLERRFVRAAKRPTSTSTLAEALRAFPSCCSNTKLKVVSKGLREIGRIPKGFDFLCNIAHIYLSCNNISSLGGLEQFPKLTTLSIADNLISTFAELRVLKNASGLHTLNLEGNPVTRLPNYRQHVLHMLPGLKNLDKRTVGPYERRDAIETLRREASALASLFENECTIEKLLYIRKLIALHVELRRNLFGGFSVFHSISKRNPGTPTLQIGLFLRLWNHSHDMAVTPSEHERICTHLRFCSVQFYNALRSEDANELVKQRKRARQQNGVAQRSGLPRNEQA